MCLISRWNWVKNEKDEKDDENEVISDEGVSFFQVNFFHFYSPRFKEIQGLLSGPIFGTPDEKNRMKITGNLCKNMGLLGRMNNTKMRRRKKNTKR